MTMYPLNILLLRKSHLLQVFDVRHSGLNILGLYDELLKNQYIVKNIKFCASRFLALLEEHGNFPIFEYIRRG